MRHDSSTVAILKLLIYFDTIFCFDASDGRIGTYQKFSSVLVLDSIETYIANICVGKL